MHYTTLAIEDEAPALKRLVKMINNHPKLVLLDVAKSTKEAAEKIIFYQPDILFLDIELKDASAFDLLANLDLQFSGKIIFVTAYDMYAVKAFEKDALDYLLKPFTEIRFAKAVDKAISRIQILDVSKILESLNISKHSSSNLMIIPEGNKNHYIDKNDLMYLISDSYYTHLISTNDKKLIRISLKKLENILPENFVRINKSTIINKHHLSEILSYKNSGKIIMKDKTDFYISEIFFKNVDYR